ncbi:Casein kinase I isoform beta [Tritrichomonas foetus]|uniref:non-specific serine/threonine protein kinase n=1 Tax=Tritrichomonas foetus TaxID=1144522 RepID=A0A1J4KNS1_9EUKA|nr:Casein kinase I isoform beta [Tritrichomonas foetus]|eukprot:OHT11069.1 Casein kinase I isoform beta [Tritrichomonas foetus]
MTFILESREGRKFNQRPKSELGVLKYEVIFDRFFFRYSFKNLIIQSVILHQIMTAKKPIPPEFKKGFEVSHFRFERMIGKGGYGYIFIVKDLEDDNYYAMKIEKIGKNKKGLLPEIEFMPTMQGTPYFPKFYGSGEEGEYRWILYEILGPSLTFMRFELPRNHYSKYTALKAGIEMLNGIEECHRRGIVHRDVKPGNFLIRPDSEHPIVLIDFGLSRPFKESPDGPIIPPREKIGFIGTTRYASPSAFEGKEQTRGDDLISWFYSLVEMIRGSLPFPPSLDREQVYQAKVEISTDKLCENLPSQFKILWEEIKDLKYEDEPNYDRIRELLQEMIDGLKKKKKYAKLDWLRISRKRMKKISGIDIQDESGDDVKVFFSQKNVQHTGPGCTIA